MITSIKEAFYKDIPCVDLENEYLRVKMIPSAGGKIQSIFDKRHSIEFLYQTPKKEFIRPGYGMSFDESDLSGFDDMFPTISPCCYPTYPWQGVCLPDHGEVWSVPWEYTLGRDFVELCCYGIKIPYKLVKKVYFSEADKLVVEYQAFNFSPLPLKFIWAAHPLVNIDEFSEVLLPGDVEKIFHTYDGANKPNAFGRIGDWAEEKGRYGAISDPGKEACGKFYVLGKLHKGECAVYNNRTQYYIKFVFPVDQVPYLGVWFNWNGYAVKQKNMALEPCTGAPDGIDIAGKYGWISEVSPKGKYAWNLGIQTGASAQKESVVM